MGGLQSAESWIWPPARNFTTSRSRRLMARVRWYSTSQTWSTSILRVSGNYYDSIERHAQMASSCVGQETTSSASSTALLSKRFAASAWKDDRRAPRPRGTRTLSLPQHPVEHRPERPVLLAVDQELGAATLGHRIIRRWFHRRGRRGLGAPQWPSGVGDRVGGFGSTRSAPTRCCPSRCRSTGATKPGWRLSASS